MTQLSPSEDAARMAAPPAPEPPKQQPQQLQQSWHRTSRAHRTAAFVKRDLAAVVRQSPFLQNPPPPPPHRHHGACALLARHEVITGAVLGRGGFAVAAEVAALALDPAVDARLTAPERRARAALARACRTPAGAPRFAVKHLQPELLRRPDDFALACADLALEAAFLSRLDHENIVRLHGLPVDGIDALLEGRHDSYFLLLERLDATLDETLQRWKAEGVASAAHLDTKLDYALQIAQALEYLHRHRIMFRDLKPHNIGLAPDGRVRLFDFGLVREYPAGACLDDVAYDLSGVGTRRYMPPEVVRGTGYNLKADVYGWAMVLWEALTLQRPYARHTEADHARRVCAGGERPPLDRGAWPASVCALLEACWTGDVAARLAVAEARARLATIVEARQRFRWAVSRTTVLPSDGDGIEVVQEETDVPVDSIGDSVGSLESERLSCRDGDDPSEEDILPLLRAASSLLTDSDDDDDVSETGLSNQDWIARHAAALLRRDDDSVSLRGAHAGRPGAPAPLGSIHGVPPPRPLRFSITV